MGSEDVRSARLRIATGMVMSNCEGASIPAHDDVQDLANRHHGTVDRAIRDGDSSQYAIGGVADDHEDALTTSPSDFALRDQRHIGRSVHEFRRRRERHAARELACHSEHLGALSPAFTRVARVDVIRLRRSSVDPLRDLDDELRIDFSPANQDRDQFVRLEATRPMVEEAT